MRSSACSRAMPCSLASRRRSARAARPRSGWSGTARPTTRPRTASTRSACCRAGRRSGTRSRSRSTTEPSWTCPAARPSRSPSPAVRRTSSSTRVRRRRRGAFTVAITNDASSELAREADAVLELRAGPEHAVAATKTYSNQLAALGLLAAHAAGEGDAFADGIRGRRRHDAAAHRVRRDAHRERREAVRVCRPDVRRRSRSRVRHRARDRAQAPRDLPHRRGAAYGHGPRARPGRGARLALPGVGDRLRRRDAARSRRGRRACTRSRCDDRRERQCGRVDSRRGVRAREPAHGVAAALAAPLDRSGPALRVGALSRARAGSGRASRACRR